MAKAIFVNIESYHKSIVLFLYLMTYNPSPQVKILNYFCTRISQFLCFINLNYTISNSGQAFSTFCLLGSYILLMHIYKYLQFHVPFGRTRHSFVTIEIRMSNEKGNLFESLKICMNT